MGLYLLAPSNQKGACFREGLLLPKLGVYRIRKGILVERRLGLLIKEILHGRSNLVIRAGMKFEFYFKFRILLIIITNFINFKMNLKHSAFAP